MNYVSYLMVYICVLFSFLSGGRKTGRLQFDRYFATGLKPPTGSTQGEEDDLEKHFTAESLG